MRISELDMHDINMIWYDIIFILAQESRGVHCQEEGLLSNGMFQHPWRTEKHFLRFQTKLATITLSNEMEDVSLPDNSFKGFTPGARDIVGPMEPLKLSF